MSGTFHLPTSSQQLGTFNKVAYVRHKGMFTGRTNSGRTDCVNGEFAVPYEITTPALPGGGNKVFVVEPPHFASGFVARDGSLGAKFLFDRGFSHVSVGYSNRMGRILDPNPGFTLKICGREVPKDPPRVTDIHIFSEAADTLRNNPPKFIFGEVERIYSIGFSDSGNAVHAMYEPFGHKLFDITFACIGGYFPPVRIPEQKPIFVFNTEYDFHPNAQPNPDFPQYRWYGVPGGAHIPDSRLSRLEFTNPPQPGSLAPAIEGTSPINWLPFVRALFMAGHRWVIDGVEPPKSVTLKVDAQGEIKRDAKNNALGGIRHPALETREATFIASVKRPPNNWDKFGGYENSVDLMTTAKFPPYLNEFKRATEKLFEDKFLLPGGRARLLREAQLHPPDTYTLNYRNGRLFRASASDDDEDE